MMHAFPLPAPTRRIAILAVAAAAAAALALFGVGATTASADGTASISGTVTDTTGAPLSALVVDLTLPGGTVVQSTGTDGAGAYSFAGLSPASYRVHFYDATADPAHAQQWWKGATTLRSATPIVIRDSSAVTGIDARLTTGGIVTGTVTANGAPASGVQVSIQSPDGAGENNGTTDAAGRFSIGAISAGPHVAEFFDSGHPTIWYGGAYSLAAARTFSVTDGATTAGIDQAIPVGATLSGTVIGPASTAGAVVLLFDAAGDRVSYPHDASGGSYSYPGLPPGTYTVELTDPDASGAFASQWWSGQTTRANATPVTLAADETRSDIDFTTSPGGSISGSVSDSTGSATVSVYGVSGAGTDPRGSTPATSVATASTDFTGAYTVGDLAVGDYLVRFDGSSGGGTALAERRDTTADESAASGDGFQWWSGASTAKAASVIHVGAGQSVAGINAALTAGGSISGTVSARLSSGATIPAANIDYTLYDANGAAVPAPGYTFPDGTYEIDGLAPGTYTIHFTEPPGAPGDFGPIWYRNGTDAGTRIVVKAGVARTGIDATLPSTDLRVGTVAISGTPVVGKTLAAKTAAWGPAGIALSYQWQRDGSAIAGATSRTYRLTNADAAHTIAVAVTGSKAGYPTETLTSDPTASVTGGKMTTAKPTISGTARAGSTLTADPGSWGPGAVTFGYQWTSGSTPIPNATAATYALTASDVGSRISVTVTGSEPGFDSAARTSASTAKVAR